MKIILFILLQISNPLERLQKLVDSVQNDPDIRNGIVAASIRSTKTGDYKLQYNAQKSVNSASVLKLASTASALSVFGSKYRFQTFLEYDGVIIDSVLKGNVYIRGTGDPSLGSKRIGSSVDEISRSFAQKIKLQGIKKVEGFIIGDGSIFSDNTLADSWIWGDIGNYYGAGITGLNINENLYSVYFKQSKFIGDFAPITRIVPEIPNIKTINKVTVGERGSGDNVMLYSTPFSTIVLSEGTIPAGENEFSVKGSIPDPPTFLAYQVQKQFNLLGGIAERPTTSFQQYKMSEGYYPKQRVVFYTYESPPLSSLVKDCNYHSINLYADAFLKSVGYNLSKDGSFDSAIKSQKQLWSRKGVDLQGFMIRDGSGLSPSGVLTANNLTDILYTMKTDEAFPEYYASIPVVGISGTVQNLAKGSKAVGNVRAKSGSISNTRAFSGYFTASSGEMMSYAYIINRYADGAEKKVRRYLEEMIKLMVEI